MHHYYDIFLFFHHIKSRHHNVNFPFKANMKYDLECFLSQAVFIFCTEILKHNMGDKHLVFQRTLTVKLNDCV